MDDRQRARGEAFRALHAEGIFALPNPWDAGSARILSALGFRALATTSAGLAFALGRRDMTVTRDESLANIRALAAATDLPLSGDLENGYGDGPEDVAATIRLAAEAGLVGGSIEDATGDADHPIYEHAEMADRFAAAVDAARSLPFPFTLVGRAENFLHGRPDLIDTIRRLQAYEEAGADVLFAPGLPDLSAVRAVVSSVSKPVNVVMGARGTGFTVQNLAEAGVRRISTGASFARAAIGGLMAAAREVLEVGSFGYLEDAPTSAAIGAMMAPEAPPRL